MNKSKIKYYFFGLILLLFIGCEGEEGQIGPAGEDGTNGLNSLVNITNEPSGANCENGGIKVEVGIDNSSNGSLDTDEILATSYVCNGVDGNTSLTSVTTEPAGANCENGGIRIDSGVDTNGDGTLDDIEITATAYVCNGIDGNNSLTKITSEAAGTNCENGGLKIDTGVDSDSDGILDDTEITASAYVCNGVDGNVSLVNITDEATGSNCENGGVKIDSGVDDDGDGTLDIEEISITRYICNGVDGGFDEQIRLTIYESPTFSISTTSSTMGTTLGQGLIKFDITSWVGVDSVIFMPNFNTSNGSVTAFAELYDGTNDSVIVGTSISTNNTSFMLYESANIYSQLPKEEITLFMQLRIASSSANAQTTGQSYLFLYRDN